MFDASPRTVRERTGGQPRTAIVTGCTEGIGAEVTARLLELGDQVLGVARHPKENPFSSHARFRFAEGDIGLHETAARVVKDALDWSGRLDILINNAARDYTDDFLGGSEEDIESVFRTNVLGTIYMLQAGASAMKNGGGGAIVNITSRLAVSGVPTMVIYGASKGAVLSLTRGAAVELAPYDIRVNAVAPGLTETPLFTAWLERQDEPSEWRDSSESDIPQRRFGTPQEVASAILFLVSDEAMHITGASLAVDGGYTAR
jgi:NAD(P)-dependent dehydrogenase (short-subunit alcohol dehydrogenase family)